MSIHDVPDFAATAGKSGIHAPQVRSTPAPQERELARRAMQPVVPDHEGYVVHVVGKYSDPNFQQAPSRGAA